MHYCYNKLYINIIINFIFILNVFTAFLHQNWEGFQVVVPSWRQTISANAPKDVNPV